MNNQNFDQFFASDSPTSSSNTSTATSHVPISHPSQTPNQFENCYRPQLPNQENQYQQYQQQQNMWNQPQPYYPQQPYPPQQQYPPQQYFQQQPYPPQQYFQQQPHPPQYFTQPTPTEQPPTYSEPEGSSSRKSRKGKKPSTAQPSRKVWTEAECLTFCKAFIAVSEDPSISTGQKLDTFWYRVMDLHNSQWSGEDRSKDSLTGKWDYLRGKVNKFNGIYSQLIQSGGRASGTSDEDLIKAALAEYRVVTAQTFPHISCWDFLKDKEKFLNPDPCVVGRRNRKRSDGSSSESPLNLDDLDFGDQFPSNVESNPRPKGRATKSQRSSSSSATGSGNAAPDAFYEGISQHVANIALNRTSDLNDMKESRLELKRTQRRKQRNIDLEFLHMPTTNYPEEIREVIERQKNEIMEKLRTGYYDI